MEIGVVNMCCFLVLDYDRIILVRCEFGKFCKFLFCMYFSIKCYFSIVRKFIYELIRLLGSVNF